jgi:hypothetical protein
MCPLTAQRQRQNGQKPATYWNCHAKVSSVRKVFAEVAGDLLNPLLCQSLDANDLKFENYLVIILP